MPINRLISGCRLRPLILLMLGVASVIVPATSRAAQAENKQPVAPDLQVEFLGADKGFAVAAQSVTVLCVIRNVGAGILPENTARVRCYPLTGLDFMDGQLWPYIPALTPNQAVAFRWRLAVTDQSTPLVFSVLITKDSKTAPDGDGNRPGGPRIQPSIPAMDVSSRLTAIAIPRFSATPHLLGTGVPAKIPQSAVQGSTARVGNDRSLVNILAARDRVPVLVVAGKDGSEWKNVAIGTPCIQVRSSEDGQLPWWESFQWTDTDVQQGKDAAALTLQGTVGQNWTARLSLESRPDTGVIFGKVRLTARRTVRLFGVQLPRLLATPAANAAPVKADGSAHILSAESPPLTGQERLAAAHTGGLTYGISWPAAPPLAAWHVSRVPVGDNEHLPVLGAEWASEYRGDVILAGATIEFSFRIFVFGPSDTIRDALRFQIPE